MYAYEEEIKRGFFTLPGGHRVGVCGQVQTEQGKILTMSHITSLNIRIAHEINGCGVDALPYLMCEDEFLSTHCVAAGLWQNNTASGSDPYSGRR